MVDRWFWLIFECGMVCWVRYLSVERCFGTDNRVWSGVIRPIFECGPVCWDRFLCVERCVWTKI